MAKLPYQQWFWDDWYADPKVTALPPLARCIWFELLGRMHQNQTFRLCADACTLARLARVSEGELLRGLKIIQKTDAGEVVLGDEIEITCRRNMMEDYERQQNTAKNREWRTRKKTTAESKKTSQNEVTNKSREDAISGQDTRTNTSDINKKEIYKEKSAIIERIYQAHPRPGMMHQTVLAIAAAIEDLVYRGESYESAIVRLEAATKAYASATGRWSPTQKIYILRSDNWFKGGGYLDNPETWQHDDDLPADNVDSGEMVVTIDGKRILKSKAIRLNNWEGPGEGWTEATE